MATYSDHLNAWHDNATAFREALRDAAAAAAAKGLIIEEVAASVERCPLVLYAEIRRSGQLTSSAKILVALNEDGGMTHGSTPGSQFRSDTFRARNVDFYRRELARLTDAALAAA